MDFVLTCGKFSEIRQNRKRLIKFYPILKKFSFGIVLLLTTLETSFKKKNNIRNL